MDRPAFIPTPSNEAILIIILSLTPIRFPINFIATWQLLMTPNYKCLKYNFNLNLSLSDIPNIRKLAKFTLTHCSAFDSFKIPAAFIKMSMWWNSFEIFSNTLSIDAQSVTSAVRNTIFDCLYWICNDSIWLSLLTTSKITKACRNLYD